MSIADKITRLQTAKTNIANAITAKGGTVGSGDGFEDFSADIATIPSGGEKVTGTVTFSSDAPQYQVFHNKNKYPVYAVIKLQAGYVFEELPFNIITMSFSSKYMESGTDPSFATSNSYVENVGGGGSAAFKTSYSIKTYLGQNYVTFNRAESGLVFKSGYTYEYEIYFE